MAQHFPTGGEADAALLNVLFILLVPVDLFSWQWQGLKRESETLKASYDLELTCMWSLHFYSIGWIRHMGSPKSRSWEYSVFTAMTMYWCSGECRIKNNYAVHHQNSEVTTVFCLFVFIFLFFTCILCSFQEFLVFSMDLFTIFWSSFSLFLH